MFRIGTKCRKTKRRKDVQEEPKERGENEKIYVLKEDADLRQPPVVKETLKTPVQYLTNPRLPTPAHSPLLGFTCYHIQILPELFSSTLTLTRVRNKRGNHLAPV